MKKTLSILLALLLVIGMFAGCAKKESGAVNNAAQVSTSTDAAEQADVESSDPATLNLSGRHWKIGGQPRQTSLYLYYAYDLGLFEDAGLDVEIITVANGPALNEALNAGEIEMAANGTAAI